MKINKVSNDLLISIQNKISEQVITKKTLENAAQCYLEILNKEFKESIVLSRLFVTVPFGKLPDLNKQFVNNIINSNNLSDLLTDETLILSLIATRGIESSWNNRLNSQGHVGIPLISAEFIDAVPMISRLLKQLGLGLDWIESNDTELVKKTIGKLSGVFYVKDAEKEIDLKGRKIITAQEFVKKYGVKTVFGIGGGYLGLDTFFTVIVFTNETIDEKTVKKFIAQTNKFKSSTLNIISNTTIFN